MIGNNVRLVNRLRVSLLALVVLASVFLVSPMAQAADNTCININTAEFDELREIIHIDEVRAGEIIEKRPFDSVDDLSRVDGIKLGGVRLDEIKEQDIACVDEKIIDKEVADEVSNENESEKTENDKEDELIVPKTSTNNSNFLFAGSLIVLFGLLGFLFVNKQKIEDFIK